MPYEILSEMVGAIKSLLRYGRFVPENQLIATSDYRLVDSSDKPSGIQSNASADDRVNKPVTLESGETFNITDHHLMMPGYYIFQLWDDHNKIYSALLYDHKGEHLHTWKLDYYETFENLLGLPIIGLLSNFLRKTR